MMLGERTVRHCLSLQADRRDAELMLARERWKQRHLVAKPAPPAVYWWPSPLGAA